MHSEAVHAGVIRVTPVGQHLDLDDLEGPVAVFLSTKRKKRINQRHELSIVR